MVEEKIKNNEINWQNETLACFLMTFREGEETCSMQAVWNSYRKPRSHVLQEHHGVSVTGLRDLHEGRNPAALSLHCQTPHDLV